MIVLTYIKSKDNFLSSVYLDMIDLCSSKFNSKTIILTGFQYDIDTLSTVIDFNKHQDFIKMCYNNRIIWYQKKPIEDLIGFKYDNIILINFDLIENQYMDELIRYKSKKSNIVGISFDDEYVDIKLFNLEIESLKNQNFTNDEIKIYMSLKFNSNKLVNSDSFESYRLNRLTKYKEIDSIHELNQYLK